MNRTMNGLLNLQNNLSSLTPTTTVHYNDNSQITPLQNFSTIQTTSHYSASIPMPHENKPYPMMNYHNPQPVNSTSAGHHLSSQQLFYDGSSAPTFLTSANFSYNPSNTAVQSVAQTTEQVRSTMETVITPPSNPSTNTTQTNENGVSIMTNACISCKLNHKKCDKVATGCNHCVRFHKQCVYANARKRGPKGNSAPTNPLTGTIEYQFVDNSKQEQKLTQEQHVEQETTSTRYMKERTYLNNIKQIELDRRYFEGINMSLFKKFSCMLAPPKERDVSTTVLIAHKNKIINYWLTSSVNSSEGQENSLEPIRPLTPTQVALIHILQAITFHRFGHSHAAKIYYQKAREKVSKCFDQVGDDYVVYIYNMMAFYLIGSECPDGCDTKSATNATLQELLDRKICKKKCLSQSKYFLSICKLYLKEVDTTNSQVATFIRQGVTLVQYFHIPGKCNVIS